MPSPFFVIQEGHSEMVLYSNLKFLKRGHMKKVVNIGRTWKKKNFLNKISCLNFRIPGNLEAPDTQSPGKLRRASLEPWPSVCGWGSAGSAGPWKAVGSADAPAPPRPAKSDFLVNKTRETCVRFPV